MSPSFHGKRRLFHVLGGQGMRGRCLNTHFPSSWEFSLRCIIGTDVFGIVFCQVSGNLFSVAGVK